MLKGHRTFIALPGGKSFFNNTGNAGMATGGSGDVLTGILTGLLAQGYAPPETAVLMGVYLHGLAGDLAAAKKSQEAMIEQYVMLCITYWFSLVYCYFLTVLFLQFGISRRHYDVIFLTGPFINYSFVDNYVRIKMVLEF